MPLDIQGGLMDAARPTFFAILEPQNQEID